MFFNIKKNKIYDIIIVDSIVDKENINDKNLNINKIMTYTTTTIKQVKSNNYEEKKNKDVDMEKCVINCNVCGEINEITEYSEMKCKYCQSDLF